MAARKPHFSFKRLQIDKATTTMTIAIVAAVSVSIFSFVAGRALLSQRSYLAKVIAKKEEAKKQLESNLDARDTLVESYKAFVSTPQNIIGGDSAGDGASDGDNARIILDALPSKYDFPALATSLEKVLLSDGLNLKIDAISGTDEELSQSEMEIKTPEPIEIPFQVEVTGSYSATQKLVDLFERSIRPFHIQTFSLTGNEDALRAEISAKTYYQPDKKIEIKDEVIK